MIWNWWQKLFWHCLPERFFYFYFIIVMNFWGISFCLQTSAKFGKINTRKGFCRKTRILTNLNLVRLSALLPPSFLQLVLVLLTGCSLYFVISLKLSLFFSVLQRLAFSFSNGTDIVSHSAKACTKTFLMTLLVSRVVLYTMSCRRGFANRRWCYHLTLSNEKSTSQQFLCRL